jgi:16S rRNA (adenine1518-N6/adenine1519-N6)-dimethyltransferase
VFGLIDVAFAQRRKTSRNAFAEWAGSGNESARRLLAASIDPSRRGETLGVADFVRLLERSGEWDEPRSRAKLAQRQQPSQVRAL